MKQVAGTALPVPGTNSGGLKQFRGSWLCPDRGPVTWRPPVFTGPREFRRPYGCGGPVTSFPLHFSLTVFRNVPMRVAFFIDYSGDIAL